MAGTQEDHILLAINKLLTLSNRRYQLIVSEYGTVEAAARDGFGLLSDPKFAVLQSHSYDQMIDLGHTQLNNMAEQGINVLNSSSDSYPEPLRHIADYPILLFYKGNIGLLNQPAARYLGCVGSRKMIQSSKVVVERLLNEIRNHRIMIVSGLASGVDSYTHQMALNLQFPCIGVLGTSLFEGDFYPKEALSLAHQIEANNGLLLSEYGQGTALMKYNFVRRNRIIAALSHAVLVVQASQNSGSCTTAEFAKEYHKKVATIAGMPYDLPFLGNQSLLREGAQLILDGRDILSILEIESVSNGPTKTDSRSTPNIPAQSQMLLSKLSLSPVTVEEIIGMSGLTLSEVSMQLSLLELEGLVTNVGSNRWIAQ
jgi:DNA processing protein